MLTWLETPNVRRVFLKSFEWQDMYKGVPSTNEWNTTASPGIFKFREKETVKEM